MTYDDDELDTDDNREIYVAIFKALLAGVIGFAIIGAYFACQ